MCLLLSIPRQNLMQAFRAVRNLFFSDIDKLGYQAQHAKPKCGCIRELHSFEGPHMGVRQFLRNESCLKIMKNAFYFMLKALFVLEIFTFLSWLFGYVEKRLDKKAMVNFKIYDVKDWTTNNRNTYITQYLKK